MHGLFGTIGARATWNFTYFEKGHYIRRAFDDGVFHVDQITLPKFLNDKYFYDDGAYFLATEGVLFEADSPQESIARYLQGEEVFWNHWRGSFCGVFYDRHNDTLLLFNDQVGSKMLFYTQAGGDWFFSSDLPILTEQLCLRTLPTYNEQFGWSMLTFGYSPIDETPIAGVHRLQAGQYVRVRGRQAETCTYHRFSNTPNHLSEQSNIEQIEVLFRQAVQRVIDKNRQYGLRHTAALSAGLDSRMSVCIAREITDEPIDVVTYSQRGFYDEYVPKEIASAWDLQMHFTPLDGGDYLRPIDRINRLTGGIICYGGSAQVADGFRAIDAEQAGVVLTGMIGDIIINSRHKKDVPVYHGLGALSTRHLHKTHALTASLQGLFPAQELYYLYVRGFNCADLGSPLILQTIGESYSPFYDVDLLQFCYSIPAAQRYNYRLYDRWIHTYHSQAEQWLHNGTRQIGKSIRTVHLFRRDIPLSDLPKRILWYLFRKLHLYNFDQAKAGESMNPMDDWYAHSPRLREDLDNYFARYIDLLDFSKELRQAASDLYASGTMMEKTLVLTLLASIHLNPLPASDGNCG